jgi:hypothetical protein
LHAQRILQFALVEQSSEPKHAPLRARMLKPTEQLVGSFPTDHFAQDHRAYALRKDGRMLLLHLAESFRFLEFPRLKHGLK